jgi:hypothetical protein
MDKMEHAGRIIVEDEQDVAAIREAFAADPSSQFDGFSTPNSFPYLMAVNQTDSAERGDVWGIVKKLSG